MMCSSRMRYARGAAVLLLVLLGTASALYAEDPPAATDPSKPTFKFGLSAGFSTMAISNSHFGRGLLWPLPTPEIPLDSYKTDVTRTELYIAPKLDMTWDLQSRGTVFGGIRGVFSKTEGDGDTWNLTADSPSHGDLDQLFVGWRSKPAAGKPTWELSYGHQDFQLSDGMVLVDGDNETSKAIYWGDPRKAWENAAIAKVDYSKMHLELFSLNADGDYYADGAGNPLGGNLGDSIQGANIEYRDQALGRFGLSRFRISDSDFPTRRGMSVTAVNGRVRPIKTKPTFEVAAEYDWQRNPGHDIEADAWFAEGTYTIVRPWYPTFGYRYSSFSGDNASTSRNEGWDSLHNGFTPRGFGYWYQGLVVGTYESLLTNLDTHFFHVTVAPPMVPGAWIKLLYYDHSFNDKSTAGMFPVGGAPVSSTAFAKELDFVVGFSASPKFDIIAAFATASPGQGGRDRSQGFGKDESLVQFTVLFHY